MLVFIVLYGSILVLGAVTPGHMLTQKTDLNVQEFFLKKVFKTYFILKYNFYIY